MNCPSLESLSKLAAGDASPTVSRHIRRCAACRKDLEIVRNARSALYPEVTVPAHLNARVMLLVGGQVARSRRPAGPLDLLVSGMLVALASGVAFVIGHGWDTAAIPVGIAYSIIGGFLGFWYHKRRSDREWGPSPGRLISGCGPPLRGTSD